MSQYKANLKGKIMTHQGNNFDHRETDKLSARASIFAWIISAVFCWALAVTSFTTFTDSDNKNPIITAQKEPNAEEAALMEQILPAAGETVKKN